MSVILLPKFRIRDGEDPEVTAARLHRKHNRPVMGGDDVEAPPYRYYPYPRAMYREWDPARYDVELYRVAGRNALDLSKPHERAAAEANLGAYESRNVGQFDCLVEGDNEPEVISEIREKNIREHEALKLEGWADTPDGVKAATRAYEMRIAAQAAERQFEDRHLGEKAAAELEAIDDASEAHVVNVPETRRQLQAEGKLKKGA